MLPDVLHFALIVVSAVWQHFILLRCPTILATCNEPDAHLIHSRCGPPAVQGILALVATRNSSVTSSFVILQQALRGTSVLASRCVPVTSRASCFASAGVCFHILCSAAYRFPFACFRFNLRVLSSAMLSSIRGSSYHQFLHADPYLSPTQGL